MQLLIFYSFLRNRQELTRSCKQKKTVEVQKYPWIDSLFQLRPKPMNWHQNFYNHRIYISDLKFMEFGRKKLVTKNFLDIKEPWDVGR